MIFRQRINHCIGVMLEQLVWKIEFDSYCVEILSCNYCSSMIKIIILFEFIEIIHAEQIQKSMLIYSANGQFKF